LLCATNHNTAPYCSCGFTSPALCWSLCPSSSCSTVWMRSPKAKVILPFIK
ncbi:unnamed protein product, partial [Larinioides sclopetarius]